MAPFVNTPAVIFTAAHQVSGLPKVLPVVANPNSTARVIDAQPPGIAQAVSPFFGSRAFQSDEWIIAGHCVRLRNFHEIDINPKDAPGQFRKVLASDPIVGISCTITTGDVEHAIMAKYDAPAVMAH